MLVPAFGNLEREPPFPHSGLPRVDSTLLPKGAAKHPSQYSGQKSSSWVLILTLRVRRVTAVASHGRPGPDPETCCVLCPKALMNRKNLANGPGSS